VCRCDDSLLFIAEYASIGFGKIIFQLPCMQSGIDGYIMNINEMTREVVALAGSQVKAAELSGVSQPNISKLCSGAIGSGIKADTAERLKAALKKLRRRHSRAAA